MHFNMSGIMEKEEAETPMLSGTNGMLSLEGRLLFAVPKSESIEPFTCDCPCYLNEIY